MQFPSSATAIRLATGARAFRESATKKPLTGGKLRNAGTEVALDGGEFGTAQESLMPYTHYIYKIQRKVKSKNTMRICSLSVPPLKHEWNQTVWSVNNLRCGTAGRCEHGCPQPLLTYFIFSIFWPIRQFRRSDVGLSSEAHELGRYETSTVGSRRSEKTVVTSLHYALQPRKRCSQQ